MSCISQGNRHVTVTICVSGHYPYQVKPQMKLKERIEWEKYKWSEEIKEKRLQREAKIELRGKELAIREKEIVLSMSMNIVRMAEIERNKGKESSTVYQAQSFGDALRGTNQVPADTVVTSSSPVNVSSLRESMCLC